MKNFYNNISKTTDVNWLKKRPKLTIISIRKLRTSRETRLLLSLSETLICSELDPDSKLTLKNPEKREPNNPDPSEENKDLKKPLKKNPLKKEKPEPKKDPKDKKDKKEKIEVIDPEEEEVEVEEEAEVAEVDVEETKETEKIEDLEDLKIITNPRSLTSMMIVHSPH
jgi:hypothetical protein